MDTLQPAPEPRRPYAFTVSFSWDGPDLPSRAQTVEFLRSLTRRDLAIAAGLLLLVFVIEPLLLFWIFSAKLSRQLAEHGEVLAASLTSQIQTEVGQTVKEALSQQSQRLITPLNAADPTTLVLPSPPAPPPPPAGKVKP